MLIKLKMNSLSDQASRFISRTSKVGFFVILLISVISCKAPIGSNLQKRAGNALIKEAQSSNDKRLLLVSDDFSNVSQNWEIEAESSYQFKHLKDDSCLDITASKGLTLWYKFPFQGDICIKYEACVVSNGGTLDRVSDLNSFWMATDPSNPDSLFVGKNDRKGTFGRYYSLQLYYMGYGGNGNSTTRFRRYDGKYDEFKKDGKRPEILVEYTDSAHLIRPNHWYSIEIRMKDGRVQYLQDGEVLVDYLDPNPLKRGWFAIRTTTNHMRVRNFLVHQL